MCLNQKASMSLLERRKILIQKRERPIRYLVGMSQGSVCL